MNDHQYYATDLLKAIATIVEDGADRGGDFYIFRHPDAPIPPLRYTNTIHKISRSVKPHHLFVVDVMEYPLIQKLAS